MDRHSGAVTLESSALGTVVCKADMHSNKETHRETERPRLRCTNREDRVRRREKKEKKNLEKDQESLWGKL